MSVVTITTVNTSRWFGSV